MEASSRYIEPEVAFPSARATKGLSGAQVRALQKNINLVTEELDLLYINMYIYIYMRGEKTAQHKNKSR
jgi:hypothetical protein